MIYKLQSIVALVLLLIVNSAPVRAVVTLPVGFSQVLVAGGITAPTTLAASPDGRFFIAQQ